MSDTLTAALHLGLENFDKIKRSFDIFEEIDQGSKSRNIFSRKGVRLLISAAVLCLGGRIAEYPRSVKSWKDEIEWFTQSPEWMVLTENQSCSSAKFPKTHYTTFTSGSSKNDGGKNVERC